jgi:hypothetical protein
MRDAELRGEVFQTVEVAGFESEKFRADDDALRVAVFGGQRGERAEEKLVAFEALHPRGHADPACGGIELKTLSEFRARGAAGEARGIDAGPNEAREVTVGDEKIRGARAVGRDVRGGNAKDRRRREAGVLGKVDRPYNGRAARPRRGPAVNVRAKTVVVDEIDLGVAHVRSEREDRFGDGGDIAHPVRRVDADGHIDLAQAVGERAGAKLKNARLEVGAV